MILLQKITATDPPNFGAPLSGSRFGGAAHPWLTTILL